mgnify:CR=1 FL=1
MSDFLKDVIKETADQLIAESGVEVEYKIGAMIGTLVRMKRNTSTNELLQISLAEKWKELKFLQFMFKEHNQQS